MSKLDVAQICFISSLLSGMEKAGIHLAKIESLCGLDKFDTSNLENYIPLSVMYAFFDQLARKEGIIDPHVTFSGDIRLTSLDGWGDMVAHVPDVLSAMTMAVKHQNVVLTNETMSLDVQGNKAIFTLQFTDAVVKGQAQMDVVNVMVVLNGLRLALGDNWDPLEIHFQSEREPCLDGLLQPGSTTKIRCKQKSSAIVFPTKFLGASMLGFRNEKSDISTIATPCSLQSKVEVVMDSITQTPSIDTFSQVFDISTRTLQRRLAEEGSDFTSVLERWRFKKATTLLEEPRVLIKEISERLHYNDVSNFERAFKRWTNTTPGEYRNL